MGHYLGSKDVPGVKLGKNSRSTVSGHEVLEADHQESIKGTTRGPPGDHQVDHQRFTNLLKVCEKLVVDLVVGLSVAVTATREQSEQSGCREEREHDRDARRHRERCVGPGK